MNYAICDSLSMMTYEKDKSPKGGLNIVCKKSLTSP
jgi:hypothetical protein